MLALAYLLLFGAFTLGAHAVLVSVTRRLAGAGPGGVPVLAAALVRRVSPDLEASVRNDLTREGRPLERAEDLVGRCLIRGVLAGGVAYVALLLAAGVWLPFPALLVAAGVFAQPLVALRGRADARRSEMIRRLPYSIDLVTLSMEAGSSFEDSVSTLVRETPHEPLHAELDQVLRDRRLGLSRREALKALSERVQSEDLTSLVTAIDVGETMGTPLGETLRTQGEAIRLARMQRAERLAREAGPKMALPNTLIMFANILLIVGPIVPSLGRVLGR